MNSDKDIKQLIYINKRVLHNIRTIDQANTILRKLSSQDINIGNSLETTTK